MKKLILLLALSTMLACHKKNDEPQPQKQQCTDVSGNIVPCP